VDFADAFRRQGTAAFEPAAVNPLLHGDVSFGFDLL
jgi:hypothetical protein